MNKKIVVVEDDAVLLQTLERMLAKSDFQVFSAPDGDIGYERVKKEKPDILISDMLLPKMHGLELCKKVKEHPDLGKVRVILMTAVYKGMRIKQELREAGADDFLEKPINTAELLIRIYKLYEELAAEEEKGAS
jgi:DNA-binding response OmpR family regulator